MTEHIRFWLQVWPRGDCWEWRGRKDRKGYGQMAGSDGSSIRAHRYAFEAAKGPLLTDQILDHLCNHRWCVKPSHLVVSTYRENTLRGTSFSAVNARKTHCKLGHPFSGDNLYINPTTGARYCVECRRRFHRESRRRIKARQAA